MALASAMRLRPDELRADFQQFYSLNIDLMGEEYTHAHAAALLSQLPRESRLLRAERPELEWGYTEALLASIEYSLRVLCWRQTKDGQRGRKPPKPVAAPGSYGAADKIRRTDLAFVNRVLGGARNG